MTPQDRISFEEFLCARVKAARAPWEAARKAKPLNMELSQDAPPADGTLMRKLAQASGELTVYLEALRDLTAMTLRGEFRPELETEWRKQRKGPARQSFAVRLEQRA